MFRQVLRIDSPTTRTHTGGRCRKMPLVTTYCWPTREIRDQRSESEPPAPRWKGGAFYNKQRMIELSHSYSHDPRSLPSPPQPFQNSTFFPLGLSWPFLKAVIAVYYTLLGATILRISNLLRGFACVRLRSRQRHMHTAGHDSAI